MHLFRGVESLVDFNRNRFCLMEADTGRPVSACKIDWRIHHTKRHVPVQPRPVPLLHRGLSLDSDTVLANRYHKKT
jgi:hypothetical protein